MFVIVVLIVAVLAIGGSLVGDGVKSAQPSDEPTNREIMDAVQKLDAKVEQVGLPSSSGVGVDSSSVGALVPLVLTGWPMSPSAEAGRATNPPTVPHPQSE